MGASWSPVRRITGGGMIACGSAYIFMYIYIYIYIYIHIYKHLGVHIRRSLRFDIFTAHLPG